MSPIANMLIQIKNAQTVGAESVNVPFSKMKLSIAQILKTNDLIAGVEKVVRNSKKSEFQYLNLKLKYDDGVGAISGIKLVSKPARRIYAGSRSLKPVRSGYGLAVISTPKGLMTGDDARKAGVGGEVLFEIW